MSFLNPVNEPVLRFSSTDASAPQINYNARVAGDVKAVLKACLVTGYGAKASAGWSIANEVNHVSEFVSPSAAMSDYRLGIDDTSASSTTWYYQYQDARVNPLSNSFKKSISFIDKTHAKNGWQLLVTAQGLVFVEIFYVPGIANTLARINYFGRVKSALINQAGTNIAFWSVGYAAPSGNPIGFFGTNSTAIPQYSINGNTTLKMAGTLSFLSGNKSYDLVAVDLTSKIYIYSGSQLYGEQPAVLVRDVNVLSDAYGVNDTSIDNRPILKVSGSIENASYLDIYARSFCIYLDYWEY